jgi:hypothetical protein
MEGLSKNPDPRVMRYLEYYTLRLTGDDDRLATKFSCTPEDSYSAVDHDETIADHLVLSTPRTRLVAPVPTAQKIDKR